MRAFSETVLLSQSIFLYSDAFCFFQYDSVLSAGRAILKPLKRCHECRYDNLSCFLKSISRTCTLSGWGRRCTPHRSAQVSKRAWDGQVRQWRRALHSWDDIDSVEKVSQKREEDAAVATPRHSRLRRCEQSFLKVFVESFCQRTPYDMFSPQRCTSGRGLLRVPLPRCRLMLHL